MLGWIRSVKREGREGESERHMDREKLGNKRGRTIKREKLGRQGREKREEGIV